MQPPLKPLHADEKLIRSKLEKFAKFATKDLIESLLPGQIEPLTTRPDGTILQGHHRIKILRDRGVDVDSLPREVVARDDSELAD